MSKTKIYKALDIFIKIAIIVISYTIIYKELFCNHNYISAFNSFAEVLRLPGTYLILVAVFFMMFINWGLEALKWKMLVNKFECISFLDSFKAILAGTTISSVFPNRAGEFIGRVFVLKKENIIKGSLVTFIGNISQLLITIILGLISLFIFSLPYINLIKSLSIILIILILLTIVLIIIVLLLLYFKIEFIEKIAQRLFQKRLLKLSKYFEVFRLYNSIELHNILLISLLRYFVFSTQFYLCFLLFGIKMNIFEGLIIISVIYLIITVIPTVALSELGVRGSVSLFVFAYYFTAIGSFDEQVKIAIVAASALIWIINLIIPALAGSYFIIKFKIIRK
jgi:uncharacterized membrane protein YbhN (UPF0104 family)